jgi:hypothetical protein
MMGIKTPADERLVLLIEECAEVVKAITGLRMTDGQIPEDFDSEARDVLYAVQLLQASADIPHMSRGEIERQENMLLVHDDEQNLLCFLCAEVIHIGTKTLRHGRSSFHPGLPGLGTNAAQLGMHCVRLVAGLERFIDTTERMNDVHKRKAQYLHHEHFWPTDG